MTHLVVLVHGLDGSAEELGCLRETILDLSPSTVVLSSRANTDRTHSGIADGGQRLAEEVKLFVSSHREELCFISFVGMSLGGIFCRYAIALLSEVVEGTVLIARLKPRVFMTLASPHLGVGNFGLLRLVPAPIAATIAHVLSRTVRELLLFDSSGAGGGPLLVAMTAESSPPATTPSTTSFSSAAAPSAASATAAAAATEDESGGAPAPFMEALRAFPRRICFANVINDTLVPCQTAAIDPNLYLSLFANRWLGQPQVVRDFEVAATSSFSSASESGDMASRGPGGGGRRGRAEEMAAALNALGWRKVLVAFPGLPNAHHKITAHRGGPVTAWLSKAGEGVVAMQAELLLEDVHTQQLPERE